MAVHVESFQKEWVNVFDVDVDTEKELTAKYAPIGQWSLPLIVYFENGKVINMKTGIVNILDITKTLENISDDELQSIRLDTIIEFSQTEKRLFEIEMHLKRVNMEMFRRNQWLRPAQPATAPLSSIKLPEDDFQLGESTAAEPEVCESCQ